MGSRATVVVEIVLVDDECIAVRWCNLGSSRGVGIPVVLPVTRPRSLYLFCTLSGQDSGIPEFKHLTDESDPSNLRPL